ncbi:hypothetical protein [Runella salmonicolor]|uniref:Uncharacterized protein n=1 Tax=Runella salmonicolor TaxID=2950278 RepID=A0ABT1FNS5_9BACT|nr:hypothetical protein [Runella salmonicolor]MCP1383150.1 hypothetical protein [Runella salmonicolor]
MRLIITLLLSYFFSSTLAQTCEKTQIKDPILIDAIGEFIINCNKVNQMYKDMGVIYIGINPDSGKAEKRISLWAGLTDSFKENPPQHYAHLFGKIILIHQFNEKSAMIKNEVPPEQLEALLNEVGDRVFIKQQRRGRWVETYNADGSLKKRSFQQIISGGGSPTSITLLINKKTGEVRKLKSV